MGRDKGLLRLAQRPLVAHVLNIANAVVEERLVVVSTKAQVDNYSRVLDPRIRIIADEGEVNSPLMGALKGFEQASGKRAVLLPCDTPFVSRKVLSLVVELCAGKNAVIPRWPDGRIEPLQAVYAVKPALEAARKATCNGKMDLRSMTENLGGARYISTLVLQQLDPELRTFFNLNTASDLRKAEHMAREMRYYRS